EINMPLVGNLEADIDVFAQLDAEGARTEVGFEVSVTFEPEIPGWDAGGRANHGDVAPDAHDAQSLPGDAQEQLAAVRGAFSEEERSGADAGGDVENAGRGNVQDQFGDRQPALSVAVGAGERRFAQHVGHLRINQFDRVERARAPEEDRAGEIIAV